MKRHRYKIRFYKIDKQRKISLNFAILHREYLSNMTTFDNIWHVKYIDIVEVHVMLVRRAHVDQIKLQHTKLICKLGQIISVKSRLTCGSTVNKLEYNVRSKIFNIIDTRTISSN